MIILGIGCNIGDRLMNLRNALAHIRAIRELTVHQVSPIYESDALLPDNAPKTWDKPYLNLALSISIELNPELLLKKIKAIEEKMGRLEHLHWSPRIIDIDILAWNEECYHTDKITIPHQELLERPFALLPLADIAPNWKYCEPNKIETGKTAKELINKFNLHENNKILLHTRQIAHRIDTPIMMGILNITTDSFSDGGKFIDPKNALIHAEKLFNAGADIIDIGAESTRPNAANLTPEEEWQRLQPILDSWQLFWANKNYKPKLSVDTRKFEIVEKLLNYKIDFFNDVSGLTNAKMIAAAKASSAKIIFMHNLGIPTNSEIILPQGEDEVLAVYQWGEQQIEKVIKLGVNKERLIFDVGIGFGKNASQSLNIIKNISKFHKLNIPLLVGHSRKSFLNQFTVKPFAERDIETAGVSEFLATQKVEYLRVHNVDQNMRLLKIKLALAS